jgi:hypothetical protein
MLPVVSCATAKVVHNTRRATNASRRAVAPLKLDARFIDTNPSLGDLRILLRARRSEDLY